jgi:hypothetical protein
VDRGGSGGDAQRRRQASDEKPWERRGGLYSKVDVMLTSSTHPDIATCHSVLAKSSVVGQNHFPIIFQSRRPLRNVGLNHFPVLSHNDYFGSHPDAMTPRDLAFFIKPFSSSEKWKIPTYI